MKQQISIVVFAAMIVNFHIFCMEKEAETNINYRNIENCLKKNITITEGIEHSSFAPDFQYSTLKTCIKNDQMDCLSLYLTYQFNPNRYHKQPSLFHCAIKRHRHKAITILSEYNPDLIPRNQDKQTPLDYAVNSKCKRCITAMANVIGNKCNELLHHGKHCGLTKHILKPGFCRECIGDLLWELKRHNLKQDYPDQTLQRFLKTSTFTADGIKQSSFPPEIQSKMLRTYIKHNVLDFLCLCLIYKFNPDLIHKTLSLLHYAIKHHNSQAIPILAEHNANLIVQNKEEQTPLDYAVSLECKACTDAMVNAIIGKINQFVLHIQPESINNYVDKLLLQLCYYKFYSPKKITVRQLLVVTDNGLVTEKNAHNNLNAVNDCKKPVILNNISQKL